MLLVWTTMEVWFWFSSNGSEDSHGESPILSSGVGIFIGRFHFFDICNLYLYPSLVDISRNIWSLGVGHQCTMTREGLCTKRAE
jgi:hypothetical protein